MFRYAKTIHLRFKINKISSQSFCMKNSRLALLLLVSTILFSQLEAQDKMSIRFGKINVEDFNSKPPAAFASANALIIADLGNSEFVPNVFDQTMSILFTKRSRIKINTKEGINAATIYVNLYTHDSLAESLEGLKAYTYNLENGKVIKTSLNNNEVLTEKQGQHLLVKKFTFPAVKEGSIIEYSYTIRSGFLPNLPSWNFQSELSCLWSEYTVGIPEFYKYDITTQGQQPLLINKVTQNYAQYRFRVNQNSNYGYYTGFTAEHAFNMTFSDPIYNLTSRKNNHRWVMKNIPAIKSTQDKSAYNDIARVEFKLVEINYKQPAK